MTNKYGSRKETFIGMDLHDGALAVVPPATFSLSPAANELVPVYLSVQMDGSSLYSGFSPGGHVYIRGLGIFSNLSCGLTDGSAAHGLTDGWNLLLALHRFGVKLTGGVSNTAGTDQITGAGTLFTQQLAVGQTLVWYDDNARMRSEVIVAIADDTNLTLSNVTQSTGMLGGNTTLRSAYPLISIIGGGFYRLFLTLNQLYDFSFNLGDISRIHRPQGRMSVAAAGTAVTGIGTAFLTDFEVGDAFAYTDDSAARRTGHIAAIASDVAMTLSGAAPSSATGVPFIDYDHHLRIRAAANNAFAFNTASMDTDFSGDNFHLDVMGVVEYTGEAIAVQIT